MLTDTHTHLYSEQFEEDIDKVIANSIEKGINRFFLPNIDMQTLPKMMGLVKKYPQNCFPMLGIHPTHITKDYEEEIKAMKAWQGNQKICAIGEIGIDLHWDKTLLKEQVAAFKMQIAWAKEWDLPIAIHCREAFDEVFEVMDALNDDKLRGIFHCFTGTVEQAKKVLDYGGFKLGIGGVVTFKNAGLDKVVEQLQISDLVLETDAPYLAPTPYRGKRNESKFLYEIAEKVAVIHKTNIDEIAKITTKNSQEIFGC